MADLATTLIRTVARAFYQTEQILVIDALVIHSTLSDQDLATVLGTQTKALRKTCGRLKEDGLVSVQARQERRTDGMGSYYGSAPQQGKERFTNRDWYFLNYHRAIDSIKYRMYRLNKHIESLGMPTTEKKDLSCSRCKSQWTELEVMDRIDMATGTFMCARCGFALDPVEEDERANENESMKRLNLQVGKLLKLLQQIDATTVPENNFEEALSKQKPIVRTESHPGAKTEIVDLPNSNLQNTKGLEIKPEKIAVQVQDDADVKRENAAAEAQARKEREARQNALPDWIVRSTVNNDITTVGAKEERLRKEREAHGAIIFDADGEEKKPAVDDSDNVMANYWRALEAEKAREKQQEKEEDGEEDEEDDEDEDDFVDVPVSGANTPANGVSGTVTTSTGMNTPLNAESSNATDDERETKRMRIEDPSSLVNGANGHVQKAAADTPAASDEDEDELEFENVS